MTHKAIFYSFVGCDDIIDPANPFRRLAFVPASKDEVESLKHDRWRVLIHDTIAATDPRFADRFWYVQYTQEPPVVLSLVLSTSEILGLLDQARTVRVISGPFHTEQEARYDMDLRWESQE